MSVVMIALEELTVDLSIQPRKVPLNAEHADEIAAAVRAGQDMPPVRVYRTPDSEHVLTRGFHRVEGYARAGKTHVPAEIREGTREDAVLDAAASAPEHQTLKFTNDDKRNAVANVLKVRPEWSNRRVADHVGVSDMLVADVRRQVQESCTSGAASTKRVGKDGKAYTVQPKKKEAGGKAKATAKADDGPAARPGTAGGPDGGGAPPDGGHAAGGGGAPEAAAVDAPRPAKVVPPPALDAWGIPVQPHAAEAFAAVPKFAELVRAIDHARRLFDEVANLAGGRFLTLPDVSSYRRGAKLDGGEYADRFVHPGLEQARKQVANARPAHTVCPWHYVEAAHPADCRTCLNHNWTPALGGSIPDSAVAAAKAAFGVEG